MAAQQLLLIVGGKRTQKSSADLTIDFTSVRIGADNLAISQGGTGGGAYLDIGSRALRSTAVPSDNADLVNKLALDTALGSLATVVSWQNAVLDVLNAPPGSPVSGDRYLVGVSPSGAFVGHANDLAQWNGSAWVFTDVENGTFVDVISYTAGVYFFNGTSWVQKDFEATTASNGIKLVGRDIRRDDAKTLVNDNASAITVRKIVYIKADGDVDLAAADVANLSDFALGVVEDASIAAAASGKIVVRPGAIIGGFSGLTPGLEYYVDKAAPGSMVDLASLTLASGDTLYFVGRAISATELCFDPRYEYVVG